MIFRRRSESAGSTGSAADGDSAAVAGGAPGAGDDEVVHQVRRLQRELAELVAGANANGGRLPPGAVPTVRDIDDVLRPLLRYIEIQSASEEEMRYLTAIVHEYLPQALGDFVALPAHYADRPGVTGTTPADDLIRQLQLLDEGANELQDLVYTGDAAKLAIQARFLDAKFRRSDLDS